VSVLAILLAGAVSGLLGGTPHRKSEEGKRLWKEGVYDDALRAFTEAQSAAPDSPVLHYDVGSTLYKQGNFAAASEALSKALATAPEALSPAASFNLGNALFRQERYEDAVEAYRRALRGAPTDADAKRNLEMALRAIEARKSPQPRQQQKEGQQKEQQQEKKNDSGKPGGSKQPQDRNDSPGDKDRKDARAPRPQGRPGEMSPDEAQQLLDRLGDEERKNLKREAARRAKSEDERREKDW
jgi:tetratricopeptide (TPR) repeat protein